MKALLLIFYVITLQYFVSGYNYSVPRSVYPKRVYPKKYDSVIYKNLQLNRKHLKKPFVDVKGLPINTKKPGENAEYTVFPPMPDKTWTVGPDADNNNTYKNLYFPANVGKELDSPKPRVKKVLATQLFPGSRKKRAAEEEADAKTENEVDGKTPEKKVNLITAEKKEDVQTPENKDVTPPKNKEDTTITENVVDVKTPEKEQDKIQQKKPVVGTPETEIDAKTPDEDADVKTPEKAIDTKAPENQVDEQKSTAKEKKVTTKKAKPKKSAKGKNKSTKKQKKGTTTRKWRTQSPKLRYTSKYRGLKGNKKKPNKKVKKTDLSKKKRKVIKRRELPEETRRLIAARDAVIEDYPYVVSIQKNGEHWCAGALLNPRLVITTANCVWKANRMTRLRIRAGSRYSNQGGQTARVAEVMKHPRWSIRKNPDHDVALLSLDSNIKFSHSVHAVDLPNRSMKPVFDDVWVTSWGTERRDGIFEKKPMTLQVYHARLLDRDKCSNTTLRYGVQVTENFICLTQTQRKAPCTRDTGAPAVSDGVLWGLASWGIRKLCGTERFPAMFSYVASPRNMDFISNATTYLMSEPRNNPFLGRYDMKNGRRKHALSRRRRLKRRMVRGG